MSTVERLDVMKKAYKDTIKLFGVQENLCFHLDYLVFPVARYGALACQELLSF